MVKWWTTFAPSSTHAQLKLTSPPGQSPNMELSQTVAAADEGSRTTTKGPGFVAELQKSAKLSDEPTPSARRPNFSTSAADRAKDYSRVLPRDHFPCPPNRQLTIFYGGQAHVFVDVPPDKANRIVQLAGADSRSWSTTYHTRKVAGEDSSNDESLLTIEREWEKNRQLSKSGSTLGANLAFSSEVQNLLRNLSEGAGRSSGQVLPPPDAAVPQSSTTTQQLTAATARVLSRSSVSRGKEINDKSENVERAVSNIKNDNLERRMLLTRSTPRREGSASRFAGTSGY